MNKQSKTWLGVVLLLAAVGVGIWYWELKHQPVPEALPVAEKTPPPPVEAKPAVSLDEGDALLKQLLGELSDGLHPWLTEADLLRRLVAATEQVSVGESPRTVLGFLGPSGSYDVVRKKKKLYPDPKSYARYDSVASAVTSVDPVRAAGVYAKLKPFADAAYAEIGRPGTTFDSALRKAISNLRAAPELGAEPELVEKGPQYAYVDPKLEGLNAAQKHLLRMGPKNAAAIQQWLQKLEAALPPTS